MAQLTPLEKRAARKSRNHSMVDMNLVSLIDVFTILIFFLLSNATEVEVLPPSNAVRLPESSAEQPPELARGKRRGALRKDLHPVEPVRGRRGTALGQPPLHARVAVEHERAAAGLGHQAERDGRLHRSPTNSGRRCRA